MMVDKFCFLEVGKEEPILLTSEVLVLSNISLYENQKCITQKAQV